MLEPYQVDRLFLLIGENPLPNWVAAVSLLRDGGTPYLIHTTHTQKQAVYLAHLLNRDVSKIQTAQPICLGDRHANAHHICQRIQALVERLPGRFGLNYTGGTKTMAVHAYRTLQAIQPDAVFSYLDPHKLAICIDSDRDDCLYIPVSVRLSLAQILQLHGLTWKTEQPPIATPTLPQAATALAKLHGNLQLAKTWRNWCHQELRSKARQGNIWQREAELAQLPPLSLQNLPEAFQQVLCQYFDASQTISLSIACQGRFKQLRQVCEWLDGTWLEHYVLQQIQAIAPLHGIHESKMSLHIKDPARPYSQWDKFEFDVAFMRDYQLFALSCTTTDKHSLCKQKLFEAALRARQLGGAEARVALVCCHDRPELLKTELEIVTRDQKLAVFGRQDLEHLSQKIADWIGQNN
ncbi:Card1-like endonuclease domain-containing protein [Scytonema millei]|uniref:DUF1887 family protein n=1 Tax=Scytonema millei VB511283 TaxID=1245923 RepID=A0A9X5E3A4_9CYAN|nr:DUF1887 family CARF protein [Scytonema millei]NHC34314.1 DUF1887 family protein [Scytonema millei VB511283]